VASNAGGRPRELPPALRRAWPPDGKPRPASDALTLAGGLAARNTRAWLPFAFLRVFRRRPVGWEGSRTAEGTQSAHFGVVPNSCSRSCCPNNEAKAEASESRIMSIHQYDNESDAEKESFDNEAAIASGFRIRLHLFILLLARHVRKDREGLRRLSTVVGDRVGLESSVSARPHDTGVSRNRSCPSRNRPRSQPADSARLPIVVNLVPGCVVNRRQVACRYG